MSKQVLIVKGSPRKNGNTSAMADAFAKGAREAGNIVTEIVLKDKTIGDCMGCGVCQGNGGICVQKDDIILLMSKQCLYWRKYIRVGNWHNQRNPVW